MLGLDRGLAMFNLFHLQEERAHKAIIAKDIVDKAEKDAGGPRPMTSEEVTLFDKLQDEIKALDTRIADVQAHEKRREQSAALIQSIEKPNGRITQADPPANGAALAASAPFKVPATARRSGVLKAFKPRDGERACDVELRAYRAGMWARAALFNDQRAANWCLNNGLGFDIRGAMSTTSNPDGGFLVPDEMSQSIIDLREQYGVFRRNCRVWPMGSDTLMIPRRAGGITIGAIGENPSSAISQSTPTFGSVQLVAKKAGGLSLLSSEIAEDAVIDLADWIAGEFAYGFALFEDQCGFIGDGTSTYLGIRGLMNLLTEANVATYIGAVTVATATHNLFSEIDVPDLAKLMAALPQYAKMNAKFYCSSVFVELVFNRLKAQAGGNTVQTLGGAPGDNYLGYPIVVSQVLPAGPSTDYDALPMVLFGDLTKSSALGDRRQVRVFPSEHRYMDTDQIGIRGTERFDIVHHDLGDGTTAGPMVALTGSSS
jgi:HK97 family phage major capsid protein